MWSTPIVLATGAGERRRLALPGGRGLFFITGRHKYQRYGNLVSVDLIKSPGLANDLEIGIAIAAAVWEDLRVNEAADADNLALAARRSRGPPAAELAARAIWVRHARALVAPVPGT